MSAILLEACVESLAEAQKAQELGAQQIELCDRLDIGGTTPSRETIKAAQDKLDLNIKVMVRPRGGDFIYSTEEIESMKQTILFCQSIKVFGVVFGILHEDGTLNTEQMTILSRLAGPMEVTIHRAIDDTPDIFEAVQQLTKIPSINCVLSAGQAQTAMDGAHTLQKMVAIAGDNLTIIPGGKVTKQNLLELHNLVGSTTYHGTKIVGALN